MTISDILTGLIDEVLVSMQAGEEVAFREAIRDVVDLHSTLLQAGEFVKDSGRRDNFAALVERSDAFERPMHDLWAREYRRLFENAVERLDQNDTYYSHMSNVPGWLIGRLDMIRPVEIAVRLIHLSHSVHYRLNRWWAKMAETQGLLDHAPCEPLALKAPSFKVYDSAIIAFVGAWESLKDTRFPPTRDEPLDWDEYSDISKLYTTHLSSTLYMLFDSLTLGNLEGAEWLCDALIKWWNTIRFRFDSGHYYIRDERTLTLELLRKPWVDAKSVIDLSMIGAGENNAPKALWASCIRNYWVDMCCVSLYALLQLGKECECEKSLPAKLAINLGLGKALRAGGAAIGEQWPIRTVESVLVAIIRQYYFDGSYRHGYRARLDKVVEELSSQGKPSMVPGRIYSGWGLEDLDSLLDGQLILLLLFVKERGSLSARLMETIHKWGEEDDAGLRQFVKQLEQWKERLHDEEFKHYAPLFACVQAQFSAANNLEEAISRLDTFITEIVNGIEGFRLGRLRQAQVSEERLDEIASWCSKFGFGKDGADIPVPLFAKVEQSINATTERTLVFRGLNKGEFVEPAMAQRAGNEDEWFGRTVSSHVAGTIMNDVLKMLQLEIVDVESHVGYWDQIKSAAEKIRQGGGTPMLFVGGRSEPKWLSNWIRSTYDEDVERPAGVKLVRDKRYKMDEYVGSLNGIPVFVAPIGSGSSFLIAKEEFHSLVFMEFKEGVFVQVSTEPVEENDSLINLRVTWRYDLALSKAQGWQFRYARKPGSVV